jgi:hypothetical protein
MLRKTHSASARDGVVLLVVISLLVLFALVGLAFVIYAEAQANTARIWREKETQEQPDMDPEMLLAYFLSELIYDSNNPLSQMQGNSMAWNMYGPTGSTVPFCGTGRQNPNVDCTAGGVKDPQACPPYTYPDLNCVFLAAQRGSTGDVLIPSFYRNGGATVLRAQGLPPPTSASGDVKNLADSAGFAGGPNDSVWMDVGFPLWNSPDGRIVRTLFAPLVLDLDNRINVNVHGNIMGNADGSAFGSLWAPNIIGVTGILAGKHASDQGFGPWEVNPAWVLTGMDDGAPFTGGTVYNESRRLFIGTWDFTALTPGPTPGRYDIVSGAPNGWGADSSLGTLNHRLPEQFAIKGHFYSPTNGDGINYGAKPGMLFSGQGGPTSFPFPVYTAATYEGWTYDTACRNHPVLFNFFQGGRGPLGQPAGYYNAFTNGRLFQAADMEALLRYTDTGSPALRSNLFSVCPVSYGDLTIGGNPAAGAKARRLTTTLSMDLNQPGVPSWVWKDATYQLPPPPTPQDPSLYPQGTPVAAAAGGVPGTFQRINLNRELPKSQGPWNWALPALLGQLLPAYDAAIPAYTPPNSGKVDPTGAQAAIAARQAMATQIFQSACLLSGLNYPPPPAPAGNPDHTYDAYRYLAQLSINIVDMIDGDDYMTCFNWNPNQKSSYANGWVFGSELPRLVMNEVYCEMTNDPADMAGPKATMPYQVKFWVELYNPLSQNATPVFFAGSAQGGYLKMSDAAKARLQIQAGSPRAASGEWEVYRLTIGAQPAKNAINPTGTIPNLRAPNNVRGMFVSTTGALVNTQIMAEVRGWDPDDPTKVDPAVGAYEGVILPGPPPDPQGSNYVLPANGALSGSSGQNKGYYVVGPKDDFPNPANANPNPTIATLRLKDQLISSISPTSYPALPNIHSRMFYTKPVSALPTLQPLAKHTLLLQRLACPGLKPNPIPGQPGYDPNSPVNPYITVDYIEDVAMNDGVKFDSTGDHTIAPTYLAPEKRFSVGRNQPFAADKSQKVDQKLKAPGTEVAGDPPQTTLFRKNIQGGTPGQQPPVEWPYDWLTFIDRPLVSPLELLHVSGFKPHELTQQFMKNYNDPATGKPYSKPPDGNDPATNQPLGAIKFQHRAPFTSRAYLDSTGNVKPIDASAARIYRLFEVFDAQVPIQFAPIGGRTPGRININSVWDVETLLALGDPNLSNFFSQPDVLDFYNGLIASRNPGGGGVPVGMPGPSDRPFKGYATPVTAAGTGIEDTLLRPDPANPNKLLFEALPNAANPNAGVYSNGHPYLKYEFLKKICNSVTTRSNVFAVFLTVGFFENAGGVWQEIGLSTNTQKRHRMFAIIDRTNVSIDINQPPGVLKQGPRPFFLTSFSDVTAPGPATIQVPATSGVYEGIPWQITAAAPNNVLVVDTGLRQEVITVTAVVPPPPPGPDGSPTGYGQISANFAKPHTLGFSISNVLPGNPGPQPRFEMRNPNYQGVVRYFSIIE